ncbi:uncharacterized protein EAE97_002361 [Botrytis byssoidea]|uniref:Alcohol acetyltransferase n=1 Tax=Botrytis byssoidea TaxID=139641 RepID=A0A9P5M2C5_9HELO|nr:uncharacterized protein EAE97_002361 [Botrytis byssoidea]KAF7950809.1 hypothetical protein EAE97_002361 [Botrytis byssoidea]
MFKFGSKTIQADNSEKIKNFRKLGNKEAYQLALHTLDRHRNKSITCRYTPPPNHPFNSNRLIRIVETAIIDVLLLHPILQGVIVDADSKNPAWKQLQQINLNEHLTWRFLQTPEDFDDVLRELTLSEIDSKFNEMQENPGWRIVVLYQERASLLEVHFTWNQVYGDGISGKIFQEDLSRHLNTATQYENIEDNTTTSPLIPLPPTAILSPPIEELYKFPLSISFLAKRLWELFTPAATSRTKLTLAYWAPIHLIPCSTQHRSFSISKTTLYDIHLTCRKKDSTLISLLHALMTVSLASQLDENTASAFQSCTTLDMRRLISLTSSTSGYSGLNVERVMGNYEMSVSHEFDKKLVAQLRDKLPGNGNQDLILSPGQLRQIWRIGANICGEIETKVARGLKDDSAAPMKFIWNWCQRLKNASQRPRIFSWSITDAGTFNRNSNIDNEIPSVESKLGGRDTWILHRAGFASSAETTGAAFVISLMSFKTAGLSVDVSWQDSVCEVAMGERVTADLGKWLEQIAEEAYP